MSIQLEAQLRENEKPQRTRLDGFVPAVVYGNKKAIKEPISLKVKKNDLNHAFQEAGQHSLIELEIPQKEPIKVIFKDLQRDIISDSIIHADFFSINEKEEIITKIPLRFLGISGAVKNLGAILVKHQDSIRLKCLPGNLVEKIDVDISSIETLADSIRAQDLTLPEGAQLAGDPRGIIANVTRAKKVVEKEDEAGGEVKAEDKKEGEKNEEEDKKEEGKK